MLRMCGINVNKMYETFKNTINGAQPVLWEMDYTRKYVAEGDTFLAIATINPEEYDVAYVYVDTNDGEEVYDGEAQCIVLTSPRISKNGRTENFGTGLIIGNTLTNYMKCIWFNDGTIRLGSWTNVIFGIDKIVVIPRLAEKKLKYHKIINTLYSSQNIPKIRRCV